MKIQYMDWVRLTESKIRFLVQGLEKNSFISLVHINPQGYQQIKEKYNQNIKKYILKKNFKFLK